MFPLQTITNDIRERLQDKLESLSLSDYGSMTAQIETLSPESIRMDGSVVELLIRADGTMTLNLDLPLN